MDPTEGVRQRAADQPRDRVWTSDLAHTCGVRWRALPTRVAPVISSEQRRNAKRHEEFELVARAHVPAAILWLAPVPVRRSVALIHGRDSTGGV